jgi:hypothetical protein
MNSILALMICLICLPACNKRVDNAPPPVRDEDNPIMQIRESYAEKDGLVSLTFDIEKFIDPKQYGQGATFMNLKGRNKYTVMQFDLTVGRHGEVISSMDGGQQFLKVLDELFDMKAKPSSMRPSTHFEHNIVEGNPIELEKGPATVKLKHANGAQFLLIVNMQTKKVEFREVNKNFRRQILQALAG